MASIQVESEKQLRILECLARYKFLTISQMVRLGLTGEKKYKTYLNTLLKKMRDRKRATISCIRFGGTHKFQQREYVYYLTKYGENDLILNTGLDSTEIKRPIGTSSMYERDYAHRKCFIDTQIAIYNWAESQNTPVILFDSYFDYVGNSHKGTLRAKTSIELDASTGKRVIPDGVFILDYNGKPKLFALEIHMGNDTGRAKRQILNHKVALDTGAISLHSGITVGNRVLYVFENRNIMKSTMEAVLNSRVITESYYNYFLFAYYDEIIANFEAWVNCEKKSINILLTT